MTEGAEIKKEKGHSVEAQLLVIPSPAPAQLSPLSSRSIIVAAIPDKTCATYRAFLLACRVASYVVYIFLETAKIIDSRFIQRLYRPNVRNKSFCKRNIT